jgi:hypothetical protein
VGWTVAGENFMEVYPQCLNGMQPAGRSSTQNAPGAYCSSCVWRILTSSDAIAPIVQQALKYATKDPAKQMEVETDVLAVGIIHQGGRAKYLPVVR